MGRRFSSDLVSLLHRPAAAALTQPLAQEFIYATGVAIKKEKKRESNAQGLNELPKIILYLDLEMYSTTLLQLHCLPKRIYIFKTFYLIKEIGHLLY